MQISKVNLGKVKAKRSKAKKGDWSNQCKSWYNAYGKWNKPSSYTAEAAPSSPSSPVSASSVEQSRDAIKLWSGGKSIKASRDNASVS